MRKKDWITFALICLGLLLANHVLVEVRRGRQQLRVYEANVRRVELERQLAHDFSPIRDFSALYDVDTLVGTMTEAEAEKLSKELKEELKASKKELEKFGVNWGGL